MQSIRSISVFNEEIPTSLNKSEKQLKKIVISVTNKSKVPPLTEINKPPKSDANKTGSSISMRLKKAQESEDVKTVVPKVELKKFDKALGEKSTENPDKEVKIDEDATPKLDVAELLSELNLNDTKKGAVKKSIKKSSDLAETPKSSMKSASKSEKETIWKSHIQLPFSKGWVRVYIQLVKPNSIFITPLDAMPDLYNYLEFMTNFYRENQSHLQRADKNSLKIGDLVVYEHDDYLNRAEVLSIDPEVILRLIDFGTEFIIDNDKVSFIALKSEKEKPSFAIEVVVKNASILNEMKEATEALMKFVSNNPKTVVLKPSKCDSTDGEDDEDENDEGEPSLKSQKSRFINNGHFLANSIMRKDMSLGKKYFISEKSELTTGFSFVSGKNIPIFVLDTSNLVRNYELTVFEYNESNLAFYDNLNSEIDEYSENNKGSVGYVPM